MHYTNVEKATEEHADIDTGTPVAYRDRISEKRNAAFGDLMAQGREEKIHRGRRRIERTRLEEWRRKHKSADQAPGYGKNNS